VTEGEKEQMLADLESGRKALLDVLSGVSDEAGASVPGPGKWSMLECVEHLAVSEEYLLGQIAAARRAEAAVSNPEREARFVAVGLDRRRAFASPEAGRPAGRFRSMPDALRHFLATRQRTIELVESCAEDLRLKLTSHPIAGTVNCHEILLMIAVHPRRHAKQIESIKAALESNT
jgi:hypothetical protein